MSTSNTNTNNTISNNSTKKIIVDFVKIETLKKSQKILIAKIKKTKNDDLKKSLTIELEKIENELKSENDKIIKLASVSYQNNAIDFEKLHNLTVEKFGEENTYLVTFDLKTKSSDNLLYVLPELLKTKQTKIAPVYSFDSLSCTAKFINEHRIDTVDNDNKKHTKLNKPFVNIVFTDIKPSFLYASNINTLIRNVNKSCQTFIAENFTAPENAPEKTNS